MSQSLKLAKPNIFSPSILLVVVLWLLVIVTALGVIYSTHDTRLKVNELSVLRHQQDDLQVEWGQYLLEESAWASYGRIEKIATEKLLMQVPAKQQIITVNANEG